MKQETRNETKAGSQSRQGIEEAVAVIHPTLNWRHSNLIKCRITVISAILPTGSVTQHLGRDGPPGRARSPGTISRKGLHPVPFTNTMAKVEMTTTALCRTVNLRVVPELVEGRSININYLIYTKIQLFTNINYFKS